MDDRELLDEFVKARSQCAFRELVERHLPVVYSAARRLVRDSHLAEEVAQSVFTTLAQKAESIRPPGYDDPILRWNTCTRIIARNGLVPREPEERIELPLE